MSSLMRLGSSAVFRKIRIWRLSSAGTGSASCRRASLPATMLRPSRPRREHNGCCGSRVSQLETAEYHLLRRAVSSRLSAIPRQPASGSSTWTLSQRITSSSSSGRRIARRISRTAPHWSAPRSLASKAARSMPMRPLRTGHPLGPAPTALSTMRRSPTSWRRCFYRGAWLREESPMLYLQRRARYGYCAVGRRRQGAATRSAAIRSWLRRSEHRSDGARSGAPVRPPRPRDRRSKCLRPCRARSCWTSCSTRLMTHRRSSRRGRGTRAV